MEQYGFTTPVEGARTSLFAATSPAVWSAKESYGGTFLVPYGKIELPSENGQSDVLAKELWETSEVVTKSVLEGKL
jgi:hypothetical protein